MDNLLGIETNLAEDENIRSVEEGGDDEVIRRILSVFMEQAKSLERKMSELDKRLDEFQRNCVECGKTLAIQQALMPAINDRIGKLEKRNEESARISDGGKDKVIWFVISSLVGIISFIGGSLLMIHLQKQGNNLLGPLLAYFGM